MPQQEIERLLEELIQAHSAHEVLEISAYKAQTLARVIAAAGVWAAAGAGAAVGEFCCGKGKGQTLHISLLRQVHGPQQEMERLREELIQAHFVNGRLQLQVRCLLRPRHVRHSVRTICNRVLPGGAATALPRHSNTPAVPAVWHASAGSVMCRQ